MLLRPRAPRPGAAREDSEQAGSDEDVSVDTGGYEPDGTEIMGAEPAIKKDANMEGSASATLEAS